MRNVPTGMEVVTRLSQQEKELTTMRKSVMRYSAANDTSATLDDPGLGRFERFRLLATNIKSRWAFDTLVGFVITAKAAFMGVNAERSIQSPGREEEPYVHYLDWLFVGFFATELLIRMLAEGWAFFQYSNKCFTWNMFDTFLVAVTLLNEANPFGLDLKLVRALRPLRLVHLARLIRFATCFKELRVMVAGILNCGRTLFWSILLLVLASYIYAVFCLTVSSDWLASLDREPEEYGDQVHGAIQELKHHFRSLPWCCYTLFKSVTGGLTWGDSLADHLHYVNMWLPFSLLLYIVVTVLCLLNVITAAFVDAATRRSADDEAHILDFIQQREERISKLTDLFERHDSDGDGILDLSEFHAVAKDWRTQSYFKELGFDFDAQQCKHIFNLFDSSGDGSVNIDEFIQGVHNLRGNARSLDMFRQFQFLNKKLDRTLKSLQRPFSTTAASPHLHQRTLTPPSRPNRRLSAGLFSRNTSCNTIQSEEDIKKDGEEEHAGAMPEAEIVEGM